MTWNHRSGDSKEGEAEDACTERGISDSEGHEEGEKMQNYILMHGDKEVAYINDKMKLQEIYDRQEMPIGFRNPQNVSLRFSLWLSHRTIPNNRIFADSLRKVTGCDFIDAMLRNMSVSITDTYWMKPEESDLTWGQVNYHDNLFSNEVSNAVIQHLSLSDVSLHPDFTTDGMLEKHGF